MDMTNKLQEEVETKLDKLKEMNVESEEYTEAVGNVTKLMDRQLEVMKLKSSEAQNEKKMKEEHDARIVKNFIDVGSIILPLAVTVWGATISLKFEETGSITTAIGRKFMDKLISKK